MRLKIAAATLLTLGTIAGTAGTAQAHDGCGPGNHRAWSGGCRPDWAPYAYRPAYYARPVVYGYGRPWGYRHVGWRGGYGGWHHRW